MASPKSLHHQSIPEFIDFLKTQRIQRFSFVYDSAKASIIPSHEALLPLADFLAQDRRDYGEHEGLFFEVPHDYDLLFGAFIHRTHRGQAQGGLRYWEYDAVADFLRDGLRLSKGMTRKNALAGLWWGGGKGAIAHNPKLDKTDRKLRTGIFKAFGHFITSLNGCYITAEDVGTQVTDMQNVFSKTRFITCIPKKFGGSGNPSEATANGVLCGMEAALEYKKMGTLDDKVVVVQGVGNVGRPLIQYLFAHGVQKVIAGDINHANIEKAAKQFKKHPLELHHLKRGDLSILEIPCDILAPCATGGILNPQTIPKLKTGIICGPANNQLEDSRRDDRLLFEKQILYIPDFLTNRMGIVHCANEQYGYVNHDDYILQHFSREWRFSIYQMTHKVLKESQKTGEPPAMTAIKIADELSLEKHPIFGHRGQKIINSLVENQWHEALRAIYPTDLS